MDEPVEEGSAGHDNSLCPELDAALGLDARYLLPFKGKPGNSLLEDMEMRVMLQLLPHNPAVKKLVGLGSCCPDGRPLGGVERPELDAGSVSD